MKKILTTQMTNSIFEVMETMFYFAIEEKTDAGSDFFSMFDKKELRACSIDFSAKSSGNIFILIPSGLLTAMTRNFMGQETDCDDPEMINGTLKEALNMIAGNALAKVDQESYTGLGIPEMVDPGTIDIPDDLTLFKTQEGLMAAFVRMDS